MKFLNTNSKNSNMSNLIKIIQVGAELFNTDGQTGAKSHSSRHCESAQRVAILRENVKKITVWKKFSIAAWTRKTPIRFYNPRSETPKTECSEVVRKLVNVLIQIFHFKHTVHLKYINRLIKWKIFNQAIRSRNRDFMSCIGKSL